MGESTETEFHYVTTQQMIAELFQRTVPNISMHIRNIYAEGNNPGGNY